MQQTVSSYSTYHRVTIPVANLEADKDRLKQLQKRLEAQPGVRLAFINPRTEMVFLVFNPAQSDLALLCGVIEEEGYVAGKPSHR